MRRHIRILLVLLLAGTMQMFASNPVVLPDWMLQAMAQPKGAYPEDTHAVVLMSETLYTVTSGDQYTEHSRRVVRILRPEGENEGSFSVPTSEGDQVSLLHAWSVDASGHTFEVKQKEFGEYNLSEEELYNDNRRFITKVPGLGVGSVVALEYDVRRHIYKAELDWFPQEDIPVKNASLILDLPPTWEYSSTWANASGRKAEPAGPNQWKWVLADIAPIEDEPLRLERASLSQRLSIAFFGNGVTSRVGSWAAIGTWYKGLADQRRNSTPEILETTQRLTTGRAGFDSRVRAIASYVQRNVRYVAISIGIGGFQPHFADDIFRHKYGDCKDKATLMATMLKQLGYPSELVLIDTDREFTKPAVPSTVFDHAILAIELPADIADDTYPSMVKTKSGKRYVIFDPTNQFTPFGLIPSYEQNSYALIATDPGELVQLPLFQPDLNFSETAGKFSLGADDVLTGEVVHRMKGDRASSMRNALSQYDGKDRSHFVELIANGSLKQASVDAPQFENLNDTDKELTINYKVKMGGYAQNAGGLLLVRPRIFGDKSMHLPKKTRNYSIELTGSRHDRDVYEIAIPAGYVVDELPDNTHVDAGFASYSSKFESDGKVIRYTRDYVVKNPHIELSKLDEVKRFENSIALDQSATAVLKKAP